MGPVPLAVLPPEQPRKCVAAERSVSPTLSDPHASLCCALPHLAFSLRSRSARFPGAEGKLYTVIYIEETNPDGRFRFEYGMRSLWERCALRW